MRTAAEPHDRVVTKYDTELWNAWMAGFDAGWDERSDDNYPVQWILRQMYWGWRRRRTKRQ